MNRLFHKLVRKLQWLRQEFRWRILKKKYKVTMSDVALRQYESVPPEDKEMLNKAIEALSRNPFLGEPVTAEDEVAIVKKMMEIETELEEEK